MLAARSNMLATHRMGASSLWGSGGGGQQLWRLVRDGGAPVRVAPDFDNDNAPCVLPDGRIVSYWYPPGVSGDVRRLKVMAGDGTVLSTDLLDGTYDVTEIGCGGA
jgi:hypothetical protein